MRRRNRHLGRFLGVFGLYATAILIVENLRTYAHYSAISSRLFNDTITASRTRGGNCSEGGKSTTTAGTELGNKRDNNNNSNNNKTTKPYTFASLPENAAERAYYRLRSRKVHPYRHEFLIDAAGLCDEDTTMVVLIHSRAQHAFKRASIRSTWGGVARGEAAWPYQREIRGRLKLGFVFGKSPGYQEQLRQESVQYGDVIQGDFVDSYRNLTLKSLLDLKWVMHHCPQVHYLMKADDDMMVNLPYLTDILASRPGLRRTIFGPLTLGAKVRRYGKWAVKKKDFPFARYPPYAQGAAYVITADVIGELFHAAEYVPQIPIDDVYVTGILGRTLGLNYARQPGFSGWTGLAPDPCAFLKDKMITSHRTQEAALRRLWGQLHTVNPRTCRVGSREKNT